MSIPRRLLTERAAIAQAIEDIEAGRTTDAVNMLRRALTWRRGTKRPDDIQRLRAYIEQAIVELTHPRGDAESALDTLKRAIRVKRA